MGLIEWREEFHTGIPSVDHEHQELVRLINELLKKLSGEESSTVVLDSLGEIYTRVSAHFALEEKVMRDRQYDEYGDHKADHEQLLDGIRDMMDEYEDNAHIDAGAFSRRLEDWFSDHFSTKDARLHKKLGV